MTTPTKIIRCLKRDLEKMMGVYLRLCHRNPLKIAYTRIHRNMTINKEALIYEINLYPPEIKIMAKNYKS